MKTITTSLFLSCLKATFIFLFFVGNICGQVTVNFLSNNTDFPILAENYVVEQNPFVVHLSNLSTSTQSYVRLNIDIQGPGITMTSRDYLQLQTFTINEGSNKYLTSFELAPYFDLENLNITGISKDAINRGKLPTGGYMVCISVIGLDKGVTLDRKCLSLYHSLHSAPNWTDQTLRDVREGELANHFKWKKSNLAPPIPYKLQIFESLSGFDSKNVAENFNPTFEVVTYNNSIVIEDLEKFLTPNTEYFALVSVDGYRAQGFENNGTSTPLYFKPKPSTSELIKFNQQAVDSPAFSIVCEQDYFSGQAGLSIDVLGGTSGAFYQLFIDGDYILTTQSEAITHFPVNEGMIDVNVVEVGSGDSSTCALQITESCSPGSPCDDGDPCTMNDTYDINCQCLGESENSLMVNNESYPFINYESDLVVAPNEFDSLYQSGFIHSVVFQHINLSEIELNFSNNYDDLGNQVFHFPYHIENYETTEEWENSEAALLFQDLNNWLENQGYLGDVSISYGQTDARLLTQSNWVWMDHLVFESDLGDLISVPIPTSENSDPVNGMEYSVSLHDLSDSIENYFWSNGSTHPSLFVSETDSNCYSIEVLTSSGCSYEATVTSSTNCDCIVGTPCFPEMVQPCFDSIGIYDSNCDCIVQPLIDSDLDGVCDELDQCPGFPDSLDFDDDQVPFGCDICYGYDDSLLTPEQVASLLDTIEGNEPEFCQACPERDIEILEISDSECGYCIDLTDSIWDGQIITHIDHIDSAGNRITDSLISGIETIDFEDVEDSIPLWQIGGNAIITTDYFDSTNQIFSLRQSGFSGGPDVPGFLLAADINTANACYVILEFDVSGEGVGFVKAQYNSMGPFDTIGFVGAAGYPGVSHRIFIPLKASYDQISLLFENDNGIFNVDNISIKALYSTSGQCISLGEEELAAHLSSILEGILHGDVFVSHGNNPECGGGTSIYVEGSTGPIWIGSTDSLGLTDTVYEAFPADCENYYPGQRLLEVQVEGCPNPEILWSNGETGPRILVDDDSSAYEVTVYCDSCMYSTTYGDSSCIVGTICNYHDPCYPGVIDENCNCVVDTPRIGTSDYRDSDGDDIPNECDPCPFIHNDLDENENGIPDCEEQTVCPCSEQPSLVYSPIVDTVQLSRIEIPTTIDSFLNTETEVYTTTGDYFKLNQSNSYPYPYCIFIDPIRSCQDRPNVSDWVRDFKDSMQSFGFYVPRVYLEDVGQNGGSPWAITIEATPNLFQQINFPYGSTGVNYNFSNQELRFDTVGYIATIEEGDCHVCDSLGYYYEWSNGYTGTEPQSFPLVNPEFGSYSVTVTCGSDCQYFLGQDGTSCTIGDSCVGLYPCAYSGEYDAYCNCISTEPPMDSDGDGVDDICDQCSGFNDHIDDDNDGVPNGCDICPGYDDILIEEGYYDMDTLDCGDTCSFDIMELDLFDVFVSVENAPEFTCDTSRCKLTGFIYQYQGSTYTLSFDQTPEFENQYGIFSPLFPSDLQAWLDNNGFLGTVGSGFVGGELPIYGTSLEFMELNFDCTFCPAFCSSDPLFSYIQSRVPADTVVSTFLYVPRSPTAAYYPLVPSEYLCCQNMDYCVYDFNTYDPQNGCYILRYFNVYLCDTTVSYTQTIYLENCFGFPFGGNGQCPDTSEYTPTVFDVETVLSVSDTTLVMGEPCDDGDSCTINDRWDEECRCRGEFVDSDNDGICDAEDTCDGPNYIDLDGDGIPDACDETLSFMCDSQEIDLCTYLETVYLQNSVPYNQLINGVSSPKMIQYDAIQILNNVTQELEIATFPSEELYLQLQNVSQNDADNDGLVDYLDFVDGSPNYITMQNLEEVCSNAEGRTFAMSLLIQFTFQTVNHINSQDVPHCYLSDAPDISSPGCAVALGIDVYEDEDCVLRLVSTDCPVLFSIDCNGNCVADTLGFTGVNGNCNDDEIIIGEDCDITCESQGCEQVRIVSNPNYDPLVDNGEPPCFCDTIAILDKDEDGVCDMDDVCPGEDDLLDSDQDGIPDCLDDCPNLKGTIGDPCDDGDPCTWGDVITPDCECIGVIIDEDNDGIIDCEPCDSAADLDGDGYIDTVYVDADGLPYCDVCPGLDDRIDRNNDGQPDCAIPPYYDIGCPVGFDILARQGIVLRFEGANVPIEIFPNPIRVTVLRRIDEENQFGGYEQIDVYKNAILENVRNLENETELFYPIENILSKDTILYLAVSYSQHQHCVLTRTSDLLVGMDCPDSIGLEQDLERLNLYYNLSDLGGSSYDYSTFYGPIDFMLTLGSGDVIEGVHKISRIDVNDQLLQAYIPLSDIPTSLSGYSGTLTLSNGITCTYDQGASVAVCTDPATGNPIRDGDPCDDGDPCTHHDRWAYDGTDCACEGKPAPDSDGDGICDAIDPCPEVANLPLDYNGDGVGDCPCDDLIILDHELVNGNDLVVSFDLTNIESFTTLDVEILGGEEDYTIEDMAFNGTIEIPNLDPGYYYRIYFRVNCIEGGFSTAEVEVDIPFGDGDNLCGKELVLENINEYALLNALNQGQTFTAYDYEVNVKQVSGRNGRYSGKGYISIPYFKMARFNVVFNDIIISSERKMIDGFIDLNGFGVAVLGDRISDAINGNLDDIINTLEDLSDKIEAVNELLSQVNEFIESTKHLVDPSLVECIENAQKELEQAKNEENEADIDYWTAELKSCKDQYDDQLAAIMSDIIYVLENGYKELFSSDNCATSMPQFEADFFDPSNSNNDGHVNKAWNDFNTFHDDYLLNSVEITGYDIETSTEDKDDISQSELSSSDLDEIGDFYDLEVNYMYCLLLNEINNGEVSSEEEFQELLRIFLNVGDEITNLIGEQLKNNVSKETLAQDSEVLELLRNYMKYSAQVKSYGNYRN